MPTVASPRNDLAGIKDIQRIERALQPHHQVERVVAVLNAQEIHLVQADAVLAGAGSVHGERALDDARVQPLGFLDLARIIGIGKNRAMEVAVADMAEDRRRQEARLEVGNRFVDAVGQARDRHADVGR